MNTNDGTQNPPYLRCDMNGGNLYGLPPYSTGPTGDEITRYAAVKAAGYAGVQGGSREPCLANGLRLTSGNRVNVPEDADRIAMAAKEEGFDCLTPHVGTGFESDSEIDALLTAILAAVEKHEVPIYVETHRATITQDVWRTVQFTHRFPDIRFNGDFSHWYTGHELVYGDLEKKWEFMAPVFDRVRFIHGRIGNPGSMQVGIGDGSNRTYVDHFREMWTRSFAGFLKSAKPGDYVIFTPELLGPDIYYARVFPNAEGELVEESDRWEQALLYCQIARECFAEAKKKLEIG